MVACKASFVVYETGLLESKGNREKVYEEKDEDSMGSGDGGGEERRMRKKKKVESQLWVLLNEIFLGRPIKNIFCPYLGLSPISGLAPFIKVGTGMHYPFFTG